MFPRKGSSVISQEVHISCVLVLLLHSHFTCTSLVQMAETQLCDGLITSWLEEEFYFKIWQCFLNRTKVLKEKNLEHVKCAKIRYLRMRSCMCRVKLITTTYMQKQLPPPRCHSLDTHISSPSTESRGVLLHTPILWCGWWLRCSLDVRVGSDGVVSHAHILLTHGPDELSNNDRCDSMTSRALVMVHCKSPFDSFREEQ